MSGQDSNQVPPTMEALLQQVAQIIQHWKSGVAASQHGPTGPDTTVDVLALILGDQAVHELRVALAAGDARANAAVAAAEPLLPQIAQQMVRTCVGLREMGRWTEMRAASTSLVRLAELAGFRKQLVDGLFLLAVASRRSQDNQGAVAAYRAVLAEVPPDDVKTRSAAHDNLALLLQEMGHLDEAVQHFECAAQIEKNPDTLATVLFNHSLAEIILGEYSRAAALQERARELLAGKPLDPARRAIMLDGEAQLLNRMGKLKEAAKRADEAAEIFAAIGAANKNFALVDRAQNARIRAALHNRLKEGATAEKCFREAMDLAARAARISIGADHYVEGYKTAIQYRLPTSDPVVQKIFVAGMLEGQGHIAESEASLRAAIEQAGSRGDHLTALRAKADLASQKFTFGDVQAAGRLTQEVIGEASARGLALPEAMAVATLSSLGETGAEFKLDPLLGLTRADQLLALHRKLAAAAQLDEKEMLWETYDPGTLDNELSLLAAKHGAYELAAERAEAATAKAEMFDDAWRLANRLAGLLKVYGTLGRSKDAEAVAGKLRSLLSGGKIGARTRLVTRRALAGHLTDTDLKQALDDGEQAVAAAEEIRNQITDRAVRSVSDRQYHDVYQRCVMLLNRSNEGQRAFDALQLGKGRALLDVMAAHNGGSGAPPDFPTIAKALAPSEALVDLAVEPDALVAYIVADGSLRIVRTAGDIEQIDESDRGEIRERAARLVTLCRENSLLIEFVGKISAALGAAKRVHLVPDRGLHNLPLHIVPVNGQPWCQLVSIGYLPAACVLLGRTDAQGGAFVAGDSRSDLPGAAAECEEIAHLYGVSARLGQDCSLKALHAALDSGPLDVVHLAVHGRGNPMRGDQAALCLADGKGGTELVDWEELASRPWRVNLVVLSGCSTGLSGPRQGYELVSVASQILQAGAGAVVACLWPVRDAAAREAMIAFHRSRLKGDTGMRDLRAALDDGRDALAAGVSHETAAIRDGRDVKPEDSIYAKPIAPELLATMDWASFVVVGNPNVSNSTK